jgi:capsid protein
MAATGAAGAINLTMEYDKMQDALQTDLNHEINALIEEWIAENPDATVATVEYAIIDAGNDFAARVFMARDYADELGDWLLEQHRDQKLTT